MQSLKIATQEDLQDCVNFAKEFHKTTAYKDIEFNADKVSNFISVLIEAPKALVLLLTNDNTNVGILIARAEEVLFGSDFVAIEVMFWVSPDSRGKSSWELVNAYEYWAKKIGCKLGSLSSLEGEFSDKLDKMYKKLNYLSAEHSYMKVF